MPSDPPYIRDLLLCISYPPSHEPRSAPEHVVHTYVYVCMIIGLPNNKLEPTAKIGHNMLI